jgi:DNA primase
MYETEKTSILKDILGHSKRTGHEILFKCPFCDHPKLKLSINLDKNKWKCWICNSSGKTISYLVKRLGSSSDIQKWKQHDESIDISNYDDTIEYLFAPVSDTKSNITVTLPNEYRNLYTTNTLLSRKVKNYLKNRGISDEIIFRYSIGYCNSGKYENRLVIPSFDKDGNINFFISRTYVSSFIKYINADAKKNRIIFNELFLDFNKPITIVEGVFDAIKAGDNSVPLLGSTLNDKSYLFEKICANNTKVYISLDAKDAKQKEIDIISLLLKYGIDVDVIKINNKYKDIGEMPMGEFESLRPNSIHIQDQLDLIDLW